MSEKKDVLPEYQPPQVMKINDLNNGSGFQPCGNGSGEHTT